MSEKIHFAFFHGRFYQTGTRGKICIHLAGTITLVTKEANTSFIIDRSCQDGKPGRNNRNVCFVSPFFHEKFMKARFWRGEEIAVGLIEHALFASKYTYQLIHLI